uniref:Uncharacterized protein n=1 Tax=Caenorhabditis japonica TaxID=281687 RepID=A0A8R1ECL0_CAEJA
MPCIWSIENHVMIVKWIPTDVPGQFQITNRYNLWNGCETDRYIHLDISDAEIREARHSGVITIDLDLISTEGFD